MFIQYSRLCVVGYKTKGEKKESENNNNFNNIIFFFTQVSYYRSGLMKMLNTILINLDKLTSFLRLSSHIIALNSIVFG